MGVILPRTSYTISNEIANERKELLSKVILVLKTYHNKILFYLERGEKVPISTITTLKVLKDTVQYEVDGKLRSRQIIGELNINTNNLSDDVALTLGFTKKDTYEIIKLYHKKLIERLVKGESVYINGLVSLHTEHTGVEYLVRSSVASSLRKRVENKGYKNVYARTSEKLKEIMHYKTNIRYS